MFGVAANHELSVLPAKTIVAGNENDSLERQDDDETRGEVSIVKREEGIDERDHNGLPQSSNKKKSPSPAAHSKSNANNNVSHSNISNSNKQQQQNQQQQSSRYYSNSNHMSNVGPRGPFPMGRGYGGHGPPPYGYHGGNYGPPPQHYHPPHPHMMPPYNNGHGPYMGPPGGMKGSYHHSIPYGGPGSYGMPSYPPHHGMNPNLYNNNNNNMNPSLSADSNSISSKSSLNSKKKRTIDGVHHSNNVPSSYPFRRSDSNSSSTSTVTAGNNTSTETHLAEDSHLLKRSNGCEVAMSSLNMGGGMMFGGQQKQRYHRRDYSGASTASSLSVGGFSLASYERVGNMENSAMTNNHKVKNSPKRHKKNNLVIDTGLRSSSSLLQPVDADDAHDHSTRFEQLSIEAKPCTSTDSGSSGGNSNLFLSLSTSPINADVDATPNMKNTAKEAKTESNKNTIFKLKVEEKDRPSDTPTPPVHGELGDSEMMSDDHSMLNHHLRGQSFTPLHHLSNGDGNGTSPSNTAFASEIAPQLSWSIAGDTPSLGDLAEWEEEANGKMKTEQKNRPSSTTSTDTRNMMISPHDFQMWKEEHELADQAVSGTTTPLPVFFEQSGRAGSENQMRFDNNHNKGGPRRSHESDQQQMHMMYNNARKHEHPFWPKHHDGMGGMPPTPMFAVSDFRDDFTGHSPMHGDRRDNMDYNHPHYPHHPGSGDRIRNLRGRVPPGANFPPMPLHIPPHISTHLPMTSPMGLGPGKAGMWSPHHGGMCVQMSPHHMGSPLNHMAQSKRKCIPLKPPIPSKFQGDMEKVKSAPVPEFTSLVNFPAHMSQKQSVNLPDGMRCCVMCGQACPCSTGTKGKKCKSSKPSDGGLAPRNSNGQDHLGDKNSGYSIIPSQNKGLCTLCDVNVWVVANSGLEIKWCKGCKNFRPWAAFGDKGLATKCLRCRERQREKYALQKEEKEKTRLVVPCKVKK